MRNGTRASRRRLRADAGAATVEFALIAPLFFMLVAGVLTFGRALHTQLELSTGAQEGARVLFTGGTDAQARDAVVAAAAVTPALTTGDVAVSERPSAPGRRVGRRRRAHGGVDWQPVQPRRLPATAAQWDLIGAASVGAGGH